MARTTHTPSLMQCGRVAALAARRAGALLARFLGRPRHVSTKRDARDLVTELDGRAERLIRRILNRAYPAFDILGEEQGLRGGRSPYRWIVDPLDGTMNFVHGVPFFGVSIGLEGHGQLLVGVIFDPMRRELFSAVRGHGAFLNGRRLVASRTPKLSQSLLSTGFSSQFRRQPAQYLRWFTTLERKSHAVRRMGSTALCLAYVAAGRLEAFYERDVWAWDVAAGIVLVREAGGHATDFSGRPPDLSAGELLASNGRIHGELRRWLRPSRRQ